MKNRLKKVLLWSGLLRFAERLLRRFTRGGRALIEEEAKRRALYRQLIPAGALCFDIGANLGNRVDTFLSLGARIVAVEPQPACVVYLRLRYRNVRRVVVVPKGAAAQEGNFELLLHKKNTTVATMSPEFIERIAERASRFSPEDWNHRMTVPVTTLDHLITQYGVPAFCKIDVEGFEVEVLEGLSKALPALSFEYTPEIIHRALACIDHLETLGRYTYNASSGESYVWALGQWVSAAEIRSFITGLSGVHISGDVYARLTTESSV